MMFIYSQIVFIIMDIMKKNERFVYDFYHTFTVIHLRDAARDQFAAST